MGAADTSCKHNITIYHLLANKQLTSDEHTTQLPYVSANHRYVACRGTKHTSASYDACRNTHYHMVKQFFKGTFHLLPVVLFINLDCFGVSCLILYISAFSEIMTPLHKIIHRPCCETFYVLLTYIKLLTVHFSNLFFLGL